MNNKPIMTWGVPVVAILCLLVVWRYWPGSASAQQSVRGVSIQVQNRAAGQLVEAASTGGDIAGVLIRQPVHEARAGLRSLCFDNTDDQQVQRILAVAIRDARPAIRVTAARGMSRLGGQANRSQVIERLQDRQEQDPVALSVLQTAAGRLYCYEAMPQLIKNLQHPDFHVRNSAYKSICKILRYQIRDFNPHADPRRTDAIVARIGEHYEHARDMLPGVYKILQRQQGR